jgi:hypothetical protein
MYADPFPFIEGVVTVVGDRVGVKVDAKSLEASVFVTSETSTCFGIQS